MDLGLAGKVAIVTGGSLGIGRATVQRLAAAGARVAVCARRPGPLDETVELVRRAGGEALAVPADISRPADVERLVAATVERWGRLDILVNNAGTSQRDAFETVSDELWQSDFDLKLFAAVRTCRLAIPHMRRQGGGRIVNVTNYGAKAPWARSAPTTVTRAAGLALTKVLSKEFAPDNILVNAVCMGYVQSAQHETKAAERGVPVGTVYDELGRNVPLGRVGRAEEAADVIVFLASSMASYVTGTSINVDGGVCATL